jgi:hypothetical protein
VSRDDLRAMLEKIAATAGDPPEHGLDGVAARRRRRTRHRRGAVATAMALAVLGIAVYPRLGWLGEEGHDVTASGSGDRSRRAELPDVVELQCTPEGIEVPVGSIQPQRDGLHVRVENTLATPTDVWVRGNDGWENSRWNSGLIRIEAGRTTEFEQPVAPGPLTVGCEIGGVREQRRVDLVDVDGIYEAPELGCPEDDGRPAALDPVTIDSSPTTQVAVNRALQPIGWRPQDVELEHYSGYREARYHEHTLDPRVEVWQSGNLVALAHLEGQQLNPDRAPEPPWEAVWFEGCASFLERSGSSGGTTQPSA